MSAPKPSASPASDDPIAGLRRQAAALLKDRIGREAYAMRAVLDRAVDFANIDHENAAIFLDKDAMLAAILSWGALGRGDNAGDWTKDWIEVNPALRGLESLRPRNPLDALTQAMGQAYPVKLSASVETASRAAQGVAGAITPRQRRFALRHF